MSRGHSWMIGTLGTYFPEHCNQNPLWTKNNPKITLGTLVTQRIHVKIMGPNNFLPSQFSAFWFQKNPFQQPWRKPTSRKELRYFWPYAEVKGSEPETKLLVMSYHETFIYVWRHTDRVTKKFKLDVGSIDLYCSILCLKSIYCCLSTSTLLW